MEIRQMLALIIRFFAIIVFIYGVNYATGAMSMMANLGSEAGQTYYLAAPACIILISILLWFFPFTVASKIASSNEASKEKIGSISYTDLRSVLFTTLALYLLFNVVSDAIYWGGFFIMYEPIPTLQEGIPVDYKAAMLTTLCELIILLPLLFGRKGFSKIVYKLRYGA